MKTIRLLSLTILNLLFLGANAQSLTQTIRGSLVDADSKEPIIGATVIVLDSDPLIGAVTDFNGDFRLEKVPVGRASIKINYVGYEEKIMPNISIGSAKEVVLNIAIVEQVTMMTGVVIEAKKDKRKTNNDMALVSSRAFTVEETQRYAGTFNDPARMVASFAGVNSNAEGNNDIVVRGNSPRGILWRMEGVEIPNPNHFAEEGSSGGAINALNSNMLANSDFATGAFAPEYGNALSGVFDISLRTGNNENREYTFGIGALGVDMTMEGPFKQGGKSSYLANYRYSSLALLDEAGIVDFGGVPKYQDGAFKVVLPTETLGDFTLFGLGGLSNIREQWEPNDSTNSAYDFHANMGVGGIINTYYLKDNAYIKSYVSLATNGSGSTYSTDEDEMEMTDRYHDDLTKSALRVSSAYHKKFDAKNKLQVGGIYSSLNYSLTSKSLNEETNQFVDILNDKGTTGYGQFYTSWKHRFNEKVTMVNGVHYLHLFLNNSYSIEPRTAVQWKLNNRNSINAGFGIHSKVESLLSYFSQVEDMNGVLTTPNKNMELPKAQHYVLGYDYGINENTHVKVETYYQRLYNIPVENDINSYYSTLNSSEWFNNVDLVNEGTGRNYGVEMTLERFFSNNFYYLVTASLYDSKYTSLDGVERRGKYSGNYLANVLVGKEFYLGKEKNKILNVSAKVSYNGGNRYHPVDLQSSINQNQTVFYDNLPYGSKGEDVLVVNFGANFQINKEKTAHIIKLEVLNATGHQARLYEYYNDRTQSIDYGRQLNMIPNLMYQLQF